VLLSLIQLVAGIGLVCLLAAWTVDNDMLAIMAGLLGTFAWGLTAYGLFDIETVGSSTTHAEPALALFAAGAALVAFLPALVDPFDAIGDAADERNPHERV
jgi:hypothetical protein